MEYYEKLVKKTISKLKTLKHVGNSYKVLLKKIRVVNIIVIPFTILVGIILKMKLNKKNANLRNLNIHSFSYSKKEDSDKSIKHWFSR